MIPAAFVDYAVYPLPVTTLLLLLIVIATLVVLIFTLFIDCVVMWFRYHT